MTNQSRVPLQAVCDSSKAHKSSLRQPSAAHVQAPEDAWGPDQAPLSRCFLISACTASQPALQNGALLMTVFEQHTCEGLAGNVKEDLDMHNRLDTIANTHA